MLFRSGVIVTGQSFRVALGVPLVRSRYTFFYTGKTAIAIARWGLRIVNVNALANFFKAAEGGTEAAAAGISSPLS